MTGSAGATGLQTCPQHTQAKDDRTRVSLNSQRLVSGFQGSRCCHWRRMRQEHSKLAAGKLTSSTPTDKAGITSPTALLGPATCQHRKLQDDSRTVRIQAPTGSRRPRHRSLRPYVPPSSAKTNGGQRSPTRRQGTCGHKQLELDIRKPAR